MVKTVKKYVVNKYKVNNNTTYFQYLIPDYRKIKINIFYAYNDKSL